MQMRAKYGRAADLFSRNPNNMVPNKETHPLSPVFVGRRRCTAKVGQATCPGQPMLPRWEKLFSENQG